MSLKPKYRKILYYYIIGWFISSLIWDLASNSFTSNDPILDKISFFLITWIIQGSMFGLLHVFLEKFLVRRVPYRNSLILSILSQVIVISTVIVIVFYIMRSAFDLDDNLSEFIGYPVIRAVFIYALITNFTISIVLQINRMLGAGNLWKVITGQFYHPRTGMRIFMFLDLRGSANLAENLGHVKYSELIQDCFYDLAIVHNYKAEIYQYVGDEVVLVWPFNKGMEDANCVRAFFAFKNKLQEKTSVYCDKYGILPEFKAGLHAGEVTIAEIGDQKREIAYHGDSIITASRIQGECNHLGANLLVSEYLFELLKLDESFECTLKDKVQLKGIKGHFNMYSIDEKNQA